MGNLEINTSYKNTVGYAYEFGKDVITKVDHSNGTHPATSSFME